MGRRGNGENEGPVMQITSMGGVIAFAGQAYYHARYDLSIVSF